MANKPIATYENHDIICSNGVDRKSSEDNRQSSGNSKFSEILPFSLFSEDGFRKGSSFNNLMPSKSTPALHASRHTLDQVLPTVSKEFPVQKPTNLNVKKRASVHFPSSPTNYVQPPTPDNPPPSPGTAEIGIHEKIHPVGQVSDFTPSLKYEYRLVLLYFKISDSQVLKYSSSAIIRIICIMNKVSVITLQPQNFKFIFCFYFN